MMRMPNHLLDEKLLRASPEAETSRAILRFFSKLYNPKVMIARDRQLERRVENDKLEDRSYLSSPEICPCDIGKEVERCHHHFGELYFEDGFYENSNSPREVYPSSGEPSPPGYLQVDPYCRSNQRRNRGAGPSRNSRLEMFPPNAEDRLVARSDHRRRSKLECHSNDLEPISGPEPEGPKKEEAARDAKAEPPSVKPRKIEQDSQLLKVESFPDNAIKSESCSEVPAKFECPQNPPKIEMKTVHCTVCSYVACTSASNASQDSDVLCTTCEDCLRCLLEERANYCCIKKLEYADKFDVDILENKSGGFEHDLYDVERSVADEVEDSGGDTVTTSFPHDEPLLIDLTNEETKATWKQNIVKRFRNEESEQNEQKAFGKSPPIPEEPEIMIADSSDRRNIRINAGTRNVLATAAATTYRKSSVALTRENLFMTNSMTITPRPIDPVIDPYVKSQGTDSPPFLLSNNFDVVELESPPPPPILKSINEQKNKEDSEKTIYIIEDDAESDLNILKNCYATVTVENSETFEKNSVNARKSKKRKKLDESNSNHVKSRIKNIPEDSSNNDENASNEIENQENQENQESQENRDNEFTITSRSEERKNVTINKIPPLRLRKVRPESDAGQNSESRKESKVQYDSNYRIVTETPSSLIPYVPSRVKWVDIFSEYDKEWESLRQTEIELRCNGKEFRRKIKNFCNKHLNLNKASAAVNSMEPEDLEKFRHILNKCQKHMSVISEMFKENDSTLNTIVGTAGLGLLPTATENPEDFIKSVKHRITNQCSDNTQTDEPLGTIGSPLPPTLLPENVKVNNPTEFRNSPPILQNYDTKSNTDRVPTVKSIEIATKQSDLLKQKCDISEECSRDEQDLQSLFAPANENKDEEENKNNGIINKEEMEVVLMDKSNPENLTEIFDNNDSEISTDSCDSKLVTVDDVTKVLFNDNERSKTEISCRNESSDNDRHNTSTIGTNLGSEPLMSILQIPEHLQTMTYASHTSPLNKNNETIKSVVPSIKQGFGVKHFADLHVETNDTISQAVCDLARNEMGAVEQENRSFTEQFPTFGDWVQSEISKQQVKTESKTSVKENQNTRKMTGSLLSKKTKSKRRNQIQLQAIPPSQVYMPIINPTISDPTNVGYNSQIPLNQFFEMQHCVPRPSVTLLSYPYLYENNPNSYDTDIPIPSLNNFHYSRANFITPGPYIPIQNINDLNQEILRQNAMNINNSMSAYQNLSGGRPTLSVLQPYSYQCSNKRNKRTLKARRVSFLERRRQRSTIKSSTDNQTKSATTSVNSNFNAELLIACEPPPLNASCSSPDYIKAESVIIKPYVQPIPIQPQVQATDQNINETLTLSANNINKSTCSTKSGNKCANCELPKCPYLCEECKVTFYCTKECQFKNWEIHQRYCPRRIPQLLKLW